MKALFLRVIRYPWQVLAAIAAVTAAAGLQLQHLAVDVSGQSLRGPAHAGGRTLSGAPGAIRGGETTVVVLHDPQLFERALATLQFRSLGPCPGADMA
jgi:hypothetical protein